MKYDKHDVCVYIGVPAEEREEGVTMLKITGKNGYNRACALVSVYIRMNLVIRRILNILSCYVPEENLRKAIIDSFENLDAKTREGFADEYAEMAKDL